MKTQTTKTICLAWLAIALLAVACDNETTQAPHIKNELRAPAYPLLSLDTDLSAWSRADTLYRQTISHSSGRALPLTGAIRVDGEVFRFMGMDVVPMEALAPISYESEWLGAYTFATPAEGWQEAGFDDSGWMKGEAAFGTAEEQNVHTLWLSPDVWVRREATLGGDGAGQGRRFVVRYSHDDTFELYVNGAPLVKTGFEWHKGVEVTIPDEIIARSEGGKLTIAAHCHNLYGGGLVDFGVYAEHEAGSCMEKTAVQKSVDVQATQTHYTFECGNVALQVSFIAPFLPGDMESMGRPVNYIAYETSSLDGEEHQVEIYFEARPDWACTKANRPSQTECYRKDGMLLTKTGSITQKLLDRDGDGWGHFYLGAEDKDASCDVDYPVRMRKSFLEKGCLENKDQKRENSVMAISRSLGKAKSASGKIMAGYDYPYAIQYFGENLRPYWNRKGNKTIEQLFGEANRDYPSLRKACDRFDREVVQEAAKLGGKEYAELCALAYRQTVASFRPFESPERELLMFTRDMGAVDIFCPASSLLLYYNTELVKALMNPVFYYCESGQWNKPYPPHDVGHYPLANGQSFGLDLPIENASNMLLLTAAVSTLDGNANYAKKHWEMLTTWAHYLLERGLNPRDQVTTDNFAPAYAQNTNLSIKTILGIAAYGRIAYMLKMKDEAAAYMAKARELAKEWERLASARDHYRMAFDRPDTTWSQKYNLVWDKTLGMDVFSPFVAEKELAYYAGKMNRYGLPLDCREQYAKADWTFWTAALAEDSATFRRFILPVHRYMNETIGRAPMADLYNTDHPTDRGFFGRPVIGAAYMRMLGEKLKTKN